MKTGNHSFDEYAVLRELKNFLPVVETWGTLTYRNPLHGFQAQNFHDAVRNAYEMTGMRTALSLEEYRSCYNSKHVKPEILERVIVERKGRPNVFAWQDKVLMKKYPAETALVGRLRACWQQQYGFDLNAAVHPALFRILARYTDQAFARWTFPVHGKGLLESMREMESGSFFSVFKSKRVRQLLHNAPTITELLGLLVGDPALYKTYLSDQQWAHPGWSGLVNRLEETPGRRSIALRDVIILELLLEIDALDHRLKGRWQPLAPAAFNPDEPLPASEKAEVQAIWQEALEWSYYEPFLTQLLNEPASQLARSIPQDTALPQHHTLGEPPSALCVIGREVSQWGSKRHIASLAYDFSTDPDGYALEGILEAAVPVYGAASLEYFFSRTNLTHASHAADDYLTGLGAVAAGPRGDLRTGLPPFLVKDHEPLRLLMVVEQVADTALQVIGRLDALQDWLDQEWIHFMVLDPETRELRLYRRGQLITYKSDRRVTEEAVH